MSKITEEKFLEIFEGLKNNKDVSYFFREEMFDKEGFKFTKDSIYWEIIFGMKFTKGFSSEWKSFGIIKNNISSCERKETFVSVKLSRKTKRKFKDFLAEEYRKLWEKKLNDESETEKEVFEGFIDSLTSNN